MLISTEFQRYLQSCFLAFTVLFNRCNEFWVSPNERLVGKEILMTNINQLTAVFLWKCHFMTIKFLE